MISLIVAASAASLAASAPVSIADPAALVSFLQSKGYKAELDMSGERPIIRSGAGGWKHSIVFHGCEAKKDCQDLLFQASWDAEKDEQRSLDKINAFNREKRFARAYVDDEQDPVVEMDVIFTDHAMDEKMLEEHLDIWDTMVANFAKHIGME
jgi:hypothetical protein